MTDSQSYDSVIHNLTIEQKEYAAKVLNESDENRGKSIAEIKRWIQESDLSARIGKNDNTMLEKLRNFCMTFIIECFFVDDLLIS